MPDMTADPQDLDETRRLLYIALAAAQLERHYDLVGTLVNALAHHGLGVDPGDAMAKLCQLVEPAPGREGGAEQREAQDWLQDILGVLTRRIAAQSALDASTGNSA